MVWPAAYQPPQAVSGSPRVASAANFGSPVSPGGLAPGYVGLRQINARVPDVATITGHVPVVVAAPGGYASNPVTIWVE
jgi:uncharacterized protein (TIGR03437 family)